MKDESGTFSPEEEADLVKKGLDLIRGVLLEVGGMYLMKGGPIWKKISAAIIITYETFVILPLFTTSIIYNKDDLETLLENAHFFLMCATLLISDFAFIKFEKDLNKCLLILGFEFYHYNEEESYGHKQMKDDCKKEVRLITNIGLLMYAAQFLILGVCQPCLVFIYGTYNEASFEEFRSRRPDVNPYLPVAIIFPFNAMTTQGFIWAFLLELIGAFFIVLNVIANSFCYVCLMINFRTQLQILSDSILNIGRRALNRYNKKYFKGIKMLSEDLYQDGQFQECLYQCLRENILHHKVLLRWMLKTRRFLRIFLFCYFTNASFMLASSAFLLTKNVSGISAVKSISLSIAELFHTFIICWYGDQCIRKSEDIFLSLYSCPWFRSGRKFKVLLHIMMTNTLKPIRTSSAIFNISASLETFNNLTSSAYSYFSVMNGMK